MATTLEREERYLDAYEQEPSRLTEAERTEMVKLHHKEPRLSDGERKRMAELTSKALGE